MKPVEWSRKAMNPSSGDRNEVKESMQVFGYIRMVWQLGMGAVRHKA